jgi:hypothetical protein
MFVLYVPFYGGGALLIREFARRAGRGWPTILVSALAFGVFEEGLITQSLFNPDYVGIRLLDYGHIPGLGIGAPWTVFVLTLHVVWSIATPIAVAEALFGKEPWLGKGWRAGWLGLFVLGAAATFGFTIGNGTHFLAPYAQLGAAAALVVALLVWAYRGFGAPAAPPAGGHWVGYLLGLGATTVFQILRIVGHDPIPAWVTTTALLALEAVALVLILRVRPPAFALAAGAMTTYFWVGLKTATEAGTPATIEQVVLVFCATALLVQASRLGRSAQRVQPTSATCSRQETGERG